MDDVVCAGIGGELVQRLQVSLTLSAGVMVYKMKGMLTSNIGNAEHSYASLLNDTALVREQRDGSGRWTRGDARCAAIRKIIAWVGARLVRSLLEDVSCRHDMGPDWCGECLTY